MCKKNILSLQIWALPKIVVSFFLWGPNVNTFDNIYKEILYLQLWAPAIFVGPNLIHVTRFAENICNLQLCTTPTIMFCFLWGPSVNTGQDAKNTNLQLWGPTKKYYSCGAHMWIQNKIQDMHPLKSSTLWPTIFL